MVTTETHSDLRILPLQKEEYSSKTKKGFGYSRYSTEGSRESSFISRREEQEESRRGSGSSGNSNRRPPQVGEDDHEEDDHESFASALEGKENDKKRVQKSSSHSSSYEAEAKDTHHANVDGSTAEKTLLPSAKKGEMSGEATDEDEDEDDILGYKRMNLKGESESDKDLIIYSLNESLQIYKDTVERIQGEKDDLEFQYEQTKREEAQKMEQEKTTLTQLKASTEEKRATLESVYQHLMKELAAKNLDYQRMESRFHSHKNKGAQRSSVDEEQDDVDGGKQMSIQEQILTLLKQVEELCQPLAAASAAANSNDKGSSKSKNSHPMVINAASDVKDYFNQLWPEMMGKYFKHPHQQQNSSNSHTKNKKKKKNKKNNKKENETTDNDTIEQEDGIYLDKRMIPPLAERLMMQILMDKILFTSIYPGVSMNKAFGTIHKWVDKRNYTWAARLRQQISVFIVKQSTEEKESIDKAIESILEAGYDQLCTLYSMTATDTTVAPPPPSPPSPTMTATNTRSTMSTTRRVVDHHLSKKDKDRLKRKWSEIVRRALKLTLAIKEQDDPIILIHPVDEGAIYDENTMKAVNIKEKNETEGEDGSEGMASVAFMITPIFMTSPYCEDPEKVFVVPAKVYCDTTTH